MGRKIVSVSNPGLNLTNCLTDLASLAAVDAVVLSGGPVVADYTRSRLRRIGSDLRNLRLKSGERVRIALRVLLEFGLDDHVLIGQRVWTRPRRHHHLLVLEGAPVLE